MPSYQQFLRDNEVESGALLGNFNEDDKYKVPSNVITELLKTKKLITKYTLDHIMCYAQISEYKINFLIKYVDDSLDNKRYASLYLVENYENFGNKTELVTFIASFAHENDSTFLDALKKAFNLYTIEDLGEGKSIKDENDIIASILNGNKKSSQIMVLNMGNENRKYINNVLRVLKNTAQFGVIYKLYKEKISNLKIDKNTAKYFYEVKKILDTLVMKHYTEFNDATKKYLDELNKDYMNKYKATKIKALSSSKAAGASKKSGGKSGGGGKKKSSGGKAKLFDLGLKNIQFEYTPSQVSQPISPKQEEPIIKSQKEKKSRPSFHKGFVDGARSALSRESNESRYERMENTSSTLNTRIVWSVVQDRKENQVQSADDDTINKQGKDAEFTF